VREKLTRAGILQKVGADNVFATLQGFMNNSQQNEEQNKAQNEAVLAESDKK
jgi:hypothetical protein